MNEVYGQKTVPFPGGRFVQPGTYIIYMYINMYIKKNKKINIYKNIQIYIYIYSICTYIKEQYTTTCRLKTQSQNFFTDSYFPETAPQSPSTSAQWEQKRTLCAQRETCKVKTIATIAGVSVVPTQTTRQNKCESPKTATHFHSIVNLECTY